MKRYKKEYPKEIIETVKKLEGERNHSIAIAEFRGKYYLYEIGRFIDSKTKRKRQASLYLGRVLEDGTIREPKRLLKYTDVKSIEEKIKLHDNRIKGPLEELINPKRDDIEILKMLSNDARIPITKIAEKLGKSNATVKRMLRKLEEKYRIKYTIEVCPRPFNLFRYYVLVKFMLGKPDYAALKIILESYPQIQLVAITRGDYDLFMYIFFEDNTQKLEDILYEIRSIKLLSDIPSEWIVSYITYAYGYIPMRDEFFKNLKNRVWHRTEGQPRRKEGQLLPSEWAILYELNRNAKISFIDIDKKYGLNMGSSLYTYNNLLYYENTKKGLIKRTTITMETPPIKYDAIFLVKQIHIGNFNRIKDKFWMHMIKETHNPINRYILVGDIGSPKGFIFISPIYNNEDIETVSGNLLNIFDNSVEITSLIIDKVLVGCLGYRIIPQEDTYQYKELIKKNKYEVIQ